MAETGLVAYLGNIEVNYANLYLGNTNSFINPFTAVGDLPTNGLVAYYSATKTSSYPGTGTTWFDISGNGLDMTTASSSAFPTFDSTNKEFNFNGTNNAIISPTKVTSITFNQTQFVWVKLGKTGAVDDGIYAGIQNQVGGGISGQWDGEGYGNQGTGWTLASSNADRPVSSGVTETVAEYVLITAVRDATSFRIYKNDASLIGSAVRSLANYSTGARPYVGTNFLNNAEPAFGGGNWGTAWFSGSLSSFGVYNRALTTNEISTIYQIGRLGS